MLKLSQITERMDVYNISRKNERLVMLLLTVECKTARWSLCRGGKNTRFKLIIACVYSWNRQTRRPVKPHADEGSPGELNVHKQNWHEEEFLLWFEHFGIIFKRTHVSRKVWGMEQYTSSDMKEKTCALNLALSLKCPRELAILKEAELPFCWFWLDFKWLIMIK